MHRLAKHPRTIKIVDSMMYVVGVGDNIAVVPQIVKAWSGSAPGLAIATWVMFVGISLMWLIYALLHNQKPLIAAQTVGLSCNLAVVVGWLLHNLV